MRAKRLLISGPLTNELFRKGKVPSQDGCEPPAGRSLFWRLNLKGRAAMLKYKRAMSNVRSTTRAGYTRSRRRHNVQSRRHHAPAHDSRLRRAADGLGRPLLKALGGAALVALARWMSSELVARLIQLVQHWL
ncbi:hypothetical protein [Kribbella hippodromi]|uniref:hypothetical protein n=1 Tax=Kribbella hippodromi TaxID=434347 RepID=UPI0031D1DB00